MKCVWFSWEMEAFNGFHFAQRYFPFYDSDRESLHTGKSVTAITEDV